MIITEKDSTEQLFLDRRKHISRILRIVSIKDGVETEIPTEKIIKNSFKYTELGSQNTEKIFGLCSNPYIEVSLKGYELEVGDEIKISFEMKNSADVDSNDVIPLGTFTISNIIKDYKNKIYTYRAYNYIIKPTTPTEFDIWKANNYKYYHPKRRIPEHTYDKMSFGILNHKCGIDNYFSGFGVYTGAQTSGQIGSLNSSFAYTITITTKVYGNEERLDDSRTTIARFNDFNKIYKVFKNRLTKSEDYSKAYELLKRYTFSETTPTGMEMNTFLENCVKNNEIYPFVMSIDISNDVSSGFYPITKDEEELFLYADKLESDSSFAERNVLCYPTEVILKGQSDGQIIERYSIYNSDNNFIEEGQGTGTNASLQMLNMEHKSIMQNIKEGGTREIFYLGSNSISNIDYSKFLDNAYELLGKTTKPSVNDPLRKIIECTTPISPGRFPKNTLFPSNFRFYPKHATFRGSDYRPYESTTNKKYGNQEIEELRIDTRAYKYSGVRYCRNGEYITKAWEFDQNDKAINHIYDLTTNELCNNQNIDVSLGLLVKLKNKVFYSISMNSIGDATLELGDYIEVNGVAAQITSLKMQGEQFIFEELEAEHGTPNKDEKEWQNVDIKTIIIGS